MKRFLGSIIVGGLIATPALQAQTVGCVKPGVYVMKSNGNMRAAFNRMQVDSIFSGVTLSSEQRIRAEGIVDEAKARSPGVAKRSDARHAEVMKSRNDRLVAIVSSAADKAKVEQNLSQMTDSPQRCDVDG
jgi:hypothetical protein